MKIRDVFGKFEAYGWETPTRRAIRSTGVPCWWGLLLVPAAAAHFYVAYRNLRHRVQS